MFKMDQSSFWFFWCQSSHIGSTWGNARCASLPPGEPPFTKKLIYSCVTLTTEIKKGNTKHVFNFFSLSPKWRNSSLNICQANCCSKCSYFSPSPWFADYLIRTSLCFLLPWFLLRIHRVAPNLEKTWNFREPTDSVSFSFSTWKWAEGHIPRISKTLLNTILFTRWVDCLSASSAGNVRPAIYVKHLPYWSPAVSTWN